MRFAQWQCTHFHLGGKLLLVIMLNTGNIKGGYNPVTNVCFSVGLAASASLVCTDPGDGWRLGRLGCVQPQETQTQNGDSMVILGFLGFSRKRCRKYFFQHSW